MTYSWKRAPIRDATSRELRRRRIAAEAQLRRAGKRARLADVDALIWRRWYVLPDAVCARLGAIVEARATRRANAAKRRR